MLRKLTLVALAAAALAVPALAPTSASAWFILWNQLTGFSCNFYCHAFDGSAETIPAAMTWSSVPMKSNEGPQQEPS